MKYDVDLKKYHRVTAIASFDLDVRNSTGLYHFIEKYGKPIEDDSILIRRKDWSDTEAANPMSIMSTIILVAEKNTELEILVDNNIENGLEVAEEIKKFLENKTNSAKSY